MGSGSACVCSTRGSSKNKAQKDPKLDYYMTFYINIGFVI